MNHRINNLLILIPFIALISIGIIMVSSASIYFADENYADPFHFASRQMIFISIGLIVMIIFSVISSDFLYKFDWVFMLISIILLCALFFSGYWYNC